MHSQMVDLQRYRANSGEENFIEQIKAIILLEEVLTVEIMLEHQSILEEKVNLSILKSLVTTRMNEIFPCLTCCGKKPNFYVRKSRQR